MLSETEHHFDDEEPDFLGFVAEDLVRVRVDHLDEDLENTFEQGDMLAVCSNEHFELDGVYEFFPH